MMHDQEQEQEQEQEQWEADLDTAMDRGEVALANKVPDWMWQVDPDTLDMTSLDMCVLAQIRKHADLSDAQIHTATPFGEGAEWVSDGRSLQRHLHWVSEHGFDVRPGTLGDHPTVYAVMGSKWRERIERARERNPRQGREAS